MGAPMRYYFIFFKIREYDYYIDLPELETFVHVYKRDHLDEFLEFWMREFEPVIWSSGHPSYVSKIVDKMIPNFPKDHIFT